MGDSNIPSDTVTSLHAVGLNLVLTLPETPKLLLLLITCFRILVLSYSVSCRCSPPLSNMSCRSILCPYLFSVLALLGCLSGNPLICAVRSPHADDIVGLSLIHI